MRTDRSAATDLWTRTLAQIPTLFGKLHYLATLRDPNTGAYQHFGLAQKFSAEEADRTLRKSHMQIFEEWLCLSLDQQKSDLEEHFTSLEGDTKTIICNWLSVSPYRAWMPADSREIERKLYLSDLQTVLESLRHDYAVAYPDPDA